MPCHFMERKEEKFGDPDPSLSTCVQPATAKEEFLIRNKREEKSG